MALISQGSNMLVEITDETYTDVNLSSPKVATLQGGWDPTFATQPNGTTIEHTLTITEGTMILENIILK